MTRGQIILSVFSVALVAVLYFFVPTKAQKKSDTASSANRDMPAKQDAAPDFNLADYKKDKMTAVSAAVKTQIETLEKQNTKESLLQLNELYVQNGMPLLACVMIKQIAEKDNKEIDWLKAGDAFNAIAMMEQKDGGLMKYAMQEATACYQKTVDINPNNIDYQIKLATGIMEGGEQPMQGVQILLKIIEKNPDHIPANLILGRYGIISGQYDKAVARLEKVVKLDPKNTEAYFYLAEAYNGLGRKDDAVKTFEQCKKMINDPNFSAEIDSYIEKIKNS